MITEFTRTDYTFIIKSDIIGNVKLASVLINHPETNRNKYKIKLFNGVYIGTYDMATLHAEDVKTFSCSGIIKFMVYDMNDNILPCENYTSTDIENNPIEILPQIMIDCINA